MQAYTKSYNKTFLFKKKIALASNLFYFLLILEPNLNFKMIEINCFLYVNKFSIFNVRMQLEVVSKCNKCLTSLHACKNVTTQIYKHNFPSKKIYREQNLVFFLSIPEPDLNFKIADPQHFIKNIFYVNKKIRYLWHLICIF